MTCIEYDFKASKPSNIGRVILLSDDTPATFPLKTAGIAGLPVSNEDIVPGSLLICGKAGKMYVMNEAGTGWYEFGGGEE